MLATGSPQGQRSTRRRNAQPGALQDCRHVRIAHPMIELGGAVRGSDRCLPIDAPAQLVRPSRMVLQPNPLQRSFGPGLKFGRRGAVSAACRLSDKLRPPSSALPSALLRRHAAFPHDVGLAERCADIMRRAYPSAAIDITKSEATATSLTTIVAKAEGVRTDLPPGAPHRRIWPSSAGLTRIF